MWVGLKVDGWWVRPSILHARTVPPAGDAWSDGTSTPPLASELEAVQSAMRPRLR